MYCDTPCLWASGGEGRRVSPIDNPVRVGEHPPPPPMLHRQDTMSYCNFNNLHLQILKDLTLKLFFFEQYATVLHHRELSSAGYVVSELF
jgi:hypothetical protein